MHNDPPAGQQRNHPPNITAVILDYGQVLAHSATAADFGRLAEKFDVSSDAFRELWETTRDPYDRGDLTPEQYWLQLAERSNTVLDRERIDRLREIEVEIWAHLDDDMLDWVTQLRRARVKTGLLSNMPRDLVSHLRAHCDWMNNFDFKTFSSEINLIKPDPAIYQHTLRGLGVSARETLFVDDRELNIKAARALGIHSIEFQSVAQLKGELEALGFPILPVGRETSSVDAAKSTERPKGKINLQL